MSKEMEQKQRFRHNMDCFFCMLYVLKDALCSFQRAMYIILCTVHWWFALVSLDDIVIFSISLEANTKLLGYVWALLRDAGVAMKSKKCELFSNTISYVVMSFNLGFWQFHNTPSTRLATSSLQRISRNYDGSWALEQSFGGLYSASYVMQLSWTESLKRSTNSTWKSSRRRATPPKNIARETNNATSISSSETNC